MNPKSFLLILIIALALFGITFIMQYESVEKDSVIVKQNDKELRSAPSYLSSFLL